MFEVYRASTFLSKMKVGVGHFWNVTDRGNPNFYEKNLSHWHFAPHKSHTASYGIEIEPLGEWRATNRLVYAENSDEREFCVKSVLKSSDSASLYRQSFKSNLGVAV